ncbi:EI24 domain-containing protein [Sulfurimonas paralvinellae]|uniref:EI24 domain-containing protein n=1 Tax=Sulfurimonas paralvinellae TaxID=317658 RepID=A0A7M1B837_9BACT|nr:EI24 domain-containing protein [Sulfurimonas paralvinellae]QOP45781.1 EI24 domain-containing protein [Sulfurimonas paralvinellae]
MQDFFDAVIFGFKEILRAKTMKFAMLGGLIISVVWIVIGIILWNPIISFSSSILTYIPFSLIRSNGAWMLSTFLWLQVVLVTFALVFAFLGNLIMEKVQREKYASLTLYIGLTSAAFWGVVWFYEGGYIYAQFLKLLTWLPFETIEKGLAYLIGFYIIYTGIIVSIIFVTSAYSGSFLQRVKERHFPYDRMYDEYEYKTITQTIKDTLIFTVASIISFPLLFIPVINFFILVGLWIWLMKDTLACDTAAFVYGEVDKEKLKEYKGAIWGLTFIGSLFNFIPVFNVFGPYFTELAMFYYLKEKRDS